MSSIDRRQFVFSVAAGVATAAVSPMLIAETTGTLANPVFRPLPLGSIKPEGWLKRQLRQQADGLSGHLDEFWADVSQSQWFGGKAEGWERAPYWLDGAIPLAWVLGDATLQAKVKGYVDKIVAGQRPDGWYAPYPADASAKPYDLWSILLANKVLVQYHEATGDAKVLTAVVRNLKAFLGTLDKTPLFDWGKFRWFEGLVSVYYVYEKTREPWLLELAGKLRAQGFDYMSFYKGSEVSVPTARRGKWTWEKHGVNAGMSIKAYALSWRYTKSEAERGFALQMIDTLDRYHGQANGMFTCDECFAGPNPVQGTELCTVVEMCYSLEQLVSLTGDTAYADRLERVAFNALPATFSPDMWGHQYDQQANQIQCTVNSEHAWSTNGDDSNVFGLEPNFGCCTANMHQGWPKFAANLWMRTANDGIAITAYAPSTASFDVRGTAVRATLETDYPFRETLTIKITPDKAIRFPLMLRVPAWAEGATAVVASEAAATLKPGSFHQIDREWTGPTEIKLHFPMNAKVSKRYNNALSIERGPLVYSLKIGETWTRINANKPGRELPHGDFEVHPSTPWNYGLVIDEAKLDSCITFSEKPVGEQPFSPDGAGMQAKVKGRRLPQWKVEHGWAGDLTSGPHESSEAIEELTLIPYGCAKLRITEFPRLA